MTLEIIVSASLTNLSLQTGPALQLCYSIINVSHWETVCKADFGRKEMFKLPTYSGHSEQITFELYFGEDTQSRFQQVPDVRPDREHKRSEAYVQTVACGLCNNKITTVQDRRM